MTAKIPLNLAVNISRLEDSTILLQPNQSLSLKPTYLSTEASDGQLYTLVYELPDGYQQYLTDGEYIDINVPLQSPSSEATDPLLPLDSVYQSETSSLVYVVMGDKVVSRQVNLGNVLGGFVEVLSGLQQGDKVITSRNVNEGDTVSIIREQ